MAAMPGDSQDPHDWDDEWNRDDWRHLEVLDRERSKESWAQWGAQLLIIALVLPLVLGVLALLLILAF